MNEIPVPAAAAVRGPLDYAGESVLEAVLNGEAAVTRRAARVDGIVIGTLVGFDEQDRPQVRADLEGWDLPVAARTLVPLGPESLGRAVAIMCELGDPAKPLILGLLHQPAPAAATVDGERLVLTAEKEVVLCCGEASITLTRAGKVIIKGTYVLSRSSGLNKIKGGAIELN